ncbi:MAG: substrate-binding domain-containing protein, partial [Ilumatobacteraceae bacterium]
MKKTRYVFASLAALALLATACGSDSNKTSSSAAPGVTGGGDTAAPADTSSDATAAPSDTASADTVDVTAGEDVTIAIITHGDGGVFWSVFQKGAEDAGKTLGITVKYQGSNNTGTDQAAMINQAVADGVDGLAVSLADPDAVRDAVKAATDAGIPLVTTNSGSDLYKDFGAFTHIGQDEFTAGAGAGEKFNEAGAKVLLCAKQEQTNTGLDARCDGAKSTFKGKFLTPITTSGDASGKQQADMKAAIDADPTIDAVFGVGPVISHDSAAAVKELGRTVTVGGVDLSPDLLKDIAAGDVLFTIDQQQYLQGYISVVALYLNVTNQNTLGGGLP